MTNIFDYNDNSILTSGPYAFTSLKRIPAKWLLNIYNLDKTSKYPPRRKGGRHPDRKLIEYIERNLEAIKEREFKPVEEVAGLGHKRRGKNGIQLTCEATGKLLYASEKDAKKDLRAAQQSSSEKKPIRSYECEHCSGWHLTSIPYKKWKGEKKK